MNGESLIVNHTGISRPPLPSISPPPPPPPPRNYNIALCFGNSGHCNDYSRQPAGIRTKRCISVHLRKQMQCTLFPKLRRVALQEIISITYARNGESRFAAEK